MRTYKGYIEQLKPHEIFVFGSNTQGRHGKGSALLAIRFGAIYGRSRGLQGQTWAIVTKDLTKSRHPSVPQASIEHQIKLLYVYAEEHWENEFLVAYKGYGVNLNGYPPAQMAVMFAGFTIPENIVFEETFYKLITDATTT
jgi:hypothetical protein